MSSRAARTRTPSGRATAARAAPAKAAAGKATPAKAAAAKGATKAAPRKTSKAEPQATPAAKPKARGRSTGKKPITPEVVEDEAEEVDEDEAAKEEEDHGEEDDVEERSGVDITSDDDVSYVSVATNEDDDEDYEVVQPAVEKAPPRRKAAARKAPTPESPKIRRSLKNGQVPVSQESPSPKKPKNAVARKPKFAVSSTPSRKRTKESYSDEDSQEEASPAKKKREETPASNEDSDVAMVESTVTKRNRQGVEMVNKRVQTAPPLPRGIGAAKATAGGTPRKLKGATAPNSADTFFNPSDVDRSSDKYRRQSKLFTDALEKSAEGGVAHVTEAMHEVHIQEPNLNEGILDFETPGAMCDLLRESYKSLPVLQPCTIDTGSSIISSALLQDHIIDGPYDVHPQALLDLVMFGHDQRADDPFVINPARADPACAKAYQYPSWKGFCMAANVNSPTPPRLICASIVVCLTCHVIEAMQMTTTPVRMIKEFLGVPLRGDLERSIAFYGTIFGREALGVQNFGAGIGENRQVGLVFRTYADVPSKPNTGRSLGGMGASPAMLRKAQTPKRNNAAGPGRSLLDMRDKTSWIAIWDAREYFTLDKSDDKQYRHENVASLPRLEQDLEFGDLAIIYHSVSTFDVVRPSGPSYGDRPPAYNEADTALSMNLYGAALLSKYGSKSI